MSIKISESTYKGIFCLKIENETICVTFLPAQGAKLCSLIYKPTGKEFILQSSHAAYPEAEYAQNYLLGDCAGVDEMFPNIDQCFYDAEPWLGTRLPDHGEVWALPWNYTIGKDDIEFHTHGVRLPYTLSKRVSIAQPCTLKTDYIVRNMSPFPMDYIWAAHMMIASQKGCALNFPEGLKKAYVTMSDSQLIGTYGDTFEYPLVHKQDGTVYDVRIHRGPEANDYQKFYFADPLPEGWGEILYPDGHRLRVEFPKEEVPYIGAIQAEGGELNIRCLFLEPCTGAFDRPDIAKLHGMNSVLPPNSESGWYLNIKVDKGNT